MNYYLSNDNVELIPYNKKHNKKTVKWLNDSETKHDFGLTKNITLKEHRKWLQDQNNVCLWAIYEKESNEHCGNLILFKNPNHRSAFFQIYIGDKRYRKKGLSKSSLIVMMNFVFHHLKFHRLWLNVFSTNYKAISLYENLGFIKEGIERESHYYENNYKNQVRYSILKEEWLIKEDIK